MGDSASTPDRPSNITAADDQTGAESGPGSADPNDEIPVPLAMWPSEIDERAQVVDALRGKGPPPRTDTQVDPESTEETERP